MNLEQVADLIVGVLLLAVAAISKVLWNHSREIARLDATMVPDEIIRGIVERETDKLHEEHKEFRSEMREDIRTVLDRIEQVRKDVAKSRATD